MKYAEILAGGKGTRMGNTKLPKQFLNLGDQPIIIQTIEKFLMNSNFDGIIVVVSGDWINYTMDLIKKYFSSNDLKSIFLVQGGVDRSETLMSGLRFIESEFGLNEDDIVVTHDAVRPFVSQRIIEENIQAAIEFGAVDTVVPSIDTIVKSNTERNYIEDIPNRDVMFQGQTPQSFNISLIMDAYNQLTDDEKLILTDAAKIVLLSKNAGKVKLVMGEQQNFKITTSFDLRLAESLIQKGGED
ncbi:2-C-methyl-D-erythritol 4-phosphate cytidylyltransferase [Latilactobacillus curvatus]|uniref:Ribitol-5-phosphate cytidylyltransferase n=1 Tax=Latilactobacillus curvatus TaxID=28038 RepID=A0AAC9ULY9_LATCU|nr:2-C-methyl-D-erythritol 4-phosphate cytidylyltransferase [Latilactobacillus curvatus]ASN59593.1 2-C-methyl-D-erythritol 4-phosphate cytidylyltransferase [Latilactobacillus curvatus]QEA48563.1 2-C-methyl-D-erythritol 4-phosphate cytidylyltransferase [Latilactobacillus curvatus]